MTDKEYNEKVAREKMARLEAKIRRFNKNFYEATGTNQDSALWHRIESLKYVLSGNHILLPAPADYPVEFCFKEMRAWQMTKRRHVLFFPTNEWVDLLKRRISAVLLGKLIMRSAIVRNQKLTITEQSLDLLQARPTKNGDEESQLDSDSDSDSGSDLDADADADADADTSDPKPKRKPKKKNDNNLAKKDDVAHALSRFYIDVENMHKTMPHINDFVTKIESIPIVTVSKNRGLPQLTVEDDAAYHENRRESSLRDAIDLRAFIYSPFVFSAIYLSNEDDMYLQTAKALKYAETIANNVFSSRQRMLFLRTVLNKYTAARTMFLKETIGGKMDDYENEVINPLFEGMLTCNSYAAYLETFQTFSAKGIALTNKHQNANMQRLHFALHGLMWPGPYISNNYIITSKTSAREIRDYEVVKRYCKNCIEFFDDQTSVSAINNGEMKRMVDDHIKTSSDRIEAINETTKNTFPVQHAWHELDQEPFFHQKNTLNMHNAFAPQSIDINSKFWRAWQKYNELACKIVACTNVVLSGDEALLFQGKLKRTFETNVATISTYLGIKPAYLYTLDELVFLDDALKCLRSLQNEPTNTSRDMDVATLETPDYKGIKEILIKSINEDENLDFGSDSVLGNFAAPPATSRFALGNNPPLDYNIILASYKTKYLTLNIEINQNKQENTRSAEFNKQFDDVWFRHRFPKYIQDNILPVEKALGDDVINAVMTPQRYDHSETNKNTTMPPNNMKCVTLKGADAFRITGQGNAAIMALPMYDVDDRQAIINDHINVMITSIRKSYEAGSKKRKVPDPSTSLAKAEDRSSEKRIKQQ